MGDLVWMRNQRPEDPQETQRLEELKRSQRPATGHPMRCGETCDALTTLAGDHEHACIHPAQRADQTDGVPEHLCHCGATWWAPRKPRPAPEDVTLANQFSVPCPVCAAPAGQSCFNQDGRPCGESWHPTSWLRPETGWWNAPRTWKDVVRCVLGFHRASSSAEFDGWLVQRCTCGAFGPSPWFYLTFREALGKWRTR